MWIERHGEKLSLFDSQFLLEFDITIPRPERKLSHFFIRFGPGGFRFLGWLNVLLMGMKGQAASGKGWDGS